MSRSGATTASSSVRMEALERRTHFDVTIESTSTVNVSRIEGHQSEAIIVVDPTDPSRLFAASNANRTSIFAYTSRDAGMSWDVREIGTGADGLPRACCDPTAAFDAFGNLFVGYVNVDTRASEILLSTDAGQTFTPLATFEGDTDQPTVVTGPDSIWIGYQLEEGGAAAHGAQVRGLGDVKKFRKKPQVVEGPPRQNLGDIAVGPQGQVMVAYARPGGGEGPGAVHVRLDDNGVRGRKFGPRIHVTNTNVGDRDAIPAQPRRTIDSAAGLAYDRSGGPYTGRVYLVYSDETENENNDVEVLLRYSEDDGRTWSNPQRVNDDDTTHSQFFPRVAVDPASGVVALAWHDARDDMGEPGVNSTDDVPNNDAELWGAVGEPTPSGVNYAPNFELSTGYSNALLSGQLIEFGDYIGLDIRDSVMYAAWGDNSNSTGDNPDGTHSLMDIYAGRAILIATAPVVGAPRARLDVQEFVRKGRNVKLTVTYSDVLGNGVLGLDNDDLLITGPSDFSATATFRNAKTKRGTVVAKYILPGPGGQWNSDDAGRYTVALRPDQVSSAAGTFAAGRDLLGSFVVNA